MSGRSAFARVKFSEQGKDNGKGPAGENAEQVYSQNINHTPHLVGDPSGSGMTHPPGIQSSGIISAPPRHSESSVQSGNGYENPIVPVGRPQPLALGPAIEKSDVRVQKEGIGNAFRNKIGKIMNVGDDGSVPSRNRPMLMASQSSLHIRPSDIVPAVDAVPALSPSGSPETETFPVAVHAEFGKYKDSFRRFLGGGRLPQSDWTSLSDVSHHPPVP